MNEDMRGALRREMGVGARGPLSPGQVINPAHMKPIPKRDQGEAPALYRGK